MPRWGLLPRLCLVPAGEGLSMATVHRRCCDEIIQLRAALERAHAVIRKCVTAGVLRHDLNQFLADEAENEHPPHIERAIASEGGEGG